MIVPQKDGSRVAKIFVVFVFILYFLLPSLNQIILLAVTFRYWADANFYLFLFLP